MASTRSIVTEACHAPAADAAAALRVAFVVEDALGHVTHARALRQAAAHEPRLDIDWLLVPYCGDGLADRLPGLPFSLRLSLRARRGLAALAAPPQALFLHTQGLAPLCLDWMSIVPAVVSLDATPAGFDTLAAAYDTRPARGLLGRFKHRRFKAVFRAARGLVAMSAWARDSLVRDYGVDPARICIVPPGVDIWQWQPAQRSDAEGPGRKLRLLFVGGDFARKGGRTLLDAWQAGLDRVCELDMVTRDAVPLQAAGLRVHHGLVPGQPELQALFAAADLFVLPSRGDASPFAVIEAMASGLPVLATNVGAVREMVAEGESGLLVPPGDVPALCQAVGALARNPARLRALGRRGRERAEKYFDGPRNAARVLDFVHARCRAAAPGR